MAYCGRDNSSECAHASTSFHFHIPSWPLSISKHASGSAKARARDENRNERDGWNTKADYEELLASQLQSVHVSMDCSRHQQRLNVSSGIAVLGFHSTRPRRRRRGPKSSLLMPGASTAGDLWGERTNCLLHAASPCSFQYAGPEVVCATRHVDAERGTRGQCHMASSAPTPRWGPGKSARSWRRGWQ